MIESFPLLPEELSLYQGISLILINLLCAFISTALSLGGGILMLVSLSFFLPPVALVPVHGAIQLGSNFSRIFVSFKEVDIKLIIPFVFGTLLGSYFGATIVENISPSLGQIGVGLFILYSIFGKFRRVISTDAVYEVIRQVHVDLLCHLGITETEAKVCVNVICEHFFERKT